jgi:hypothetical protein
MHGFLVNKYAVHIFRDPTATGSGLCFLMLQLRSQHSPLRIYKKKDVYNSQPEPEDDEEEDAEPVQAEGPGPGACRRQKPSRT